MATISLDKTFSYNSLIGVLPNNILYNVKGLNDKHFEIKSTT